MVQILYSIIIASGVVSLSCPLEPGIVGHYLHVATIVSIAVDGAPVCRRHGCAALELVCELGGNTQSVLISECLDGSYHMALRISVSD